MTPTRYVFCRLATAFGFGRKNVRMGDAASEMHLLKEAESILGKAIWEHVEDIEELSVEYWSIRKLRKERDRVATELQTCQKDLEQAHEERSGLLSFGEEPFQEFVEERRAILKNLEDLARERDEIVAKARDVRRAYDGIKMKQEVLEKEGPEVGDELEKTNVRIAELKKKFAELKEQRGLVGDKINDGNQLIDEIEAKIREKKMLRREKASEAFQHIGDANQKISNLSAELGVLDTQMRQLYSEIGRYVSRQVSENSSCRKACKHYRGLVDVMAALRRSVQYNYRLAELSS